MNVPIWVAARTGGESRGARPTWPGLALGVLALVATACSGGDDDAADKCTTPVVEGSPFLSSGTGAVHGSGMLPSGLPNGYNLELMVNAGSFSSGVLPPNLFDQPKTCGRSFKYTLTALDAGTYRLDYNLYNPSSSSTDPDFTGTSTNQFTVADGEDVEFDAVY